MDITIVVAVIAAASGVIVTSFSYYLTKKKEREADWRKYKYEHYKEFVVSISGVVAGDSTPKGKRIFARTSNTLHLIGSKGGLVALHALSDAIGDTGLSRAILDDLLSKLIWEIRQDLGTPGTPDASDFSARVWGSGSSGTGKRNIKAVSVQKHRSIQRVALDGFEAGVADDSS